MNSFMRSRPSGIYIWHLPLSEHSASIAVYSTITRLLVELLLMSHDPGACERPVMLESDELDNLNTREKDHTRQLSNDLQLTMKMMVYQ
jgi:hypothetical protein